MNDTVYNSDDNFSAAVADEIIDPEAMQNFEALADKVGMTHEQAQTVWNWMTEGAARLITESKKKLDDHRAEAEAMLRREFGASFDAKREKAAELVRRFGGEETLEFMTANGIADCPEIVSFLMRLSDVLGEDGGLAGEKRVVFSSGNRLKEEIARLMAEKAYMNVSDPGHDEAVRKVYALRRRLCGE